MPNFYRIIAIVIVALMVSGMFLYSDYVRRQLSINNTRIINAYSRLWALAATRSVGAGELNIIFEEIIQKCDFPMILTNTEGVPMSWRNIDIEHGDTTKAASEKLLKIIRRMDGERQPVPVFVGSSNRVLGYIHFGDSKLVRLLRLVPLIELLLLAAMFALYYIGYERLKSYGEQNIWLGMAKETAHQLGTPITSLNGWLELLKEDIEFTKESGAFPAMRHDPEEILEKMIEDIDILNKIVFRFGQIGSVPELNPTDLPGLLRGVVGYLEERMPRLIDQIEISEDYDPVPPVMANRLLLSWAVENLIKNSMEAAPMSGGKIKVATRVDVEGARAQIIITDNGHGIPARHIRRIFKPGFTTKKRGWGLGLSLAMRIVEEYHFGKLSLLESKPNEKTTFVISFPLEKIGGI